MSGACDRTSPITSDFASTHNFNHLDLGLDAVAVLSAGSCQIIEIIFSVLRLVGLESRA
jgi:hypothetical protein